MIVQCISIKHANVNNLKDVSIDIPLNKYVVFVGKSGSGKSTLAENVILGGYLTQNPNVYSPIKPIMFKQKEVIPYSDVDMASFLGIKNHDLFSYINTNKKFSDDFKKTIVSIIQLLKIGDLDTNIKVSEMSLSIYNKIRFIKLLIKNDSKLIIVDELGAGLSITESNDISKCFRLLVNSGYSILAVEHSLPIIRNSDYIVELGPGAGAFGGTITFVGTTEEYIKTKQWSQMTSVLCKNDCVPKKLSKGISINNINYRIFASLDVSIPFGGIVTVCGESGSGKSSLLDVIFRACDKSASAWKNREGIDGNIEGKNNLRRPYLIDQNPIGNNSMSTPATYTGIMNSIRNIYEKSAEENSIIIDKSFFSYNSKGKCQECNGKGSYEIKSNDEIIFQHCDLCRGQRYNDTALSVVESEITIGDTLMLSCQELYDIYSKDPRKNILSTKLGFINQIGLSYLRLGQPSGSLSGGESQRIKITKELSKKLGDRCLFILDSPAKGLHMLDLPLIMSSLRKLVDKNNSIVIAENNPYFINMSDWIIYLENGKIVFSGLPSKCPKHLYNKIKWENV